MAIKIQSTKDVHQDGIKVVVYGASGVGKTVLCSTAPNPIIISSESGLLSLNKKDLPFIEVKSIQEIGEAFNYCKASSYNTICLDSLTDIAETVLAEFRKEVADGRQAYMKLAEALHALIRNFRDLKGKHVVFIAKQKRVEDDETGIASMEPYMPGKVLPYNLPYLVDEVFAMRVNRKGERYLQTSADRKFIAKDRSGRLEAEETPDLSMVFSKIIGA
jgi:Cdc6-like AAA superfamily ATPase